MSRRSSGRSDRKNKKIPRRVSKEERLRRGAKEERRGHVTKEKVSGRVSEEVITGTYIASDRGFGFVSAGGDEDIFIRYGDENGAFHGDTVEVRLKRRSRAGRPEGRVVRVTARSVYKIVGTYVKHGHAGLVRPDNRRYKKSVVIPSKDTAGALSGQKVVASITDYGEGGDLPKGKVREILGFTGEVGIDVLSIAKEYDLPTEFPEEAMEEASRAELSVSEADMSGRKDLRGLLTVTIDGEDAKDLDDAVTVTREGTGYRLGVHIADVSNYVRENGALDREAKKRGTSVYLADRVIPMLPPALSNDICSLNQGEDRLALSCIMDIDSEGNLTGHEITESVIRVDRRMTYTSVKKILEDHDESEIEKYGDFVPMFETMRELSGKLREKRRGRGAIDFDFPEARVLLDGDGRPIEITAREGNVATRIIEDFMLIANETVAEEYFQRKIPFVYRVHEAPDAEKMRKLAAYLANFGYTLRVGTDVSPAGIQKLLRKAEGKDEEGLINRLALRSMKQAAYSPENVGHFGLAARYYCHFTSPIRRYPDLQIHRIIKENLHGSLTDERKLHYKNILEDVAKTSSERERTAQEAERETVKLKEAEYMAGYVGEIFDGIISGVTKWGFYVELKNTVEGLVRVSSLSDDYYEYSEDDFALTGVRGKKSYRLGQKVTVRVTGVDIQRRNIDFELA